MRRDRNLSVAVAWDIGDTKGELIGDSEEAVNRLSAWLGTGRA